MSKCDHDLVYSGQTNLSCKFAYICRKCGECGWSETYVLEQVNFDEYCRLRVVRGWASTRPIDASARHGARLSPAPLKAARLRLPAPPRTPTFPTPSRRWPLVTVIGYFVFAVMACLLAAIPWGKHDPILPLWLALVSAGLGIFTATMLYIAWKQGSDSDG